jgi:uncharacterized RDD family membrane protein YckC
MKCPKCGYLGFEHVDRCRDCGYDFSLTSPADTPELSIRRDTSPTPLEDLSLLDAGLASNDAPADLVLPDLDGAAATPPSRRSGRESSTPGELPLFSGPPRTDDEPLITKPSPPRAPLAVRRATPEIQRIREVPRSPSLDLTLDEPEPAPASFDSWSPPVESRETAADATVAARVIAVVIDLLILAVVDAVVIYLTMKICGLTFDEIALLPKAPLIAFLFVQNGGYLVAFTAGGQTLGKMAAGIRVVPADDNETLDLGRAFLRTLVAVPAGLGFLSALFRRDHRGLHDRFAGTRVVR